MRVPLALAIAAGVLALAATVPPGARAQVDLPDTPARRRAPAMLRRAVGGGDAARRALVAEGFAPSLRDAFGIEEHLRIQAEMQRRSGGYDAVEVRDSDAFAIQVLVQARNDGALRMLTLRTETEPPHRIAGMGMRPLTPADGVEAPAVPERRLPDEEIASMLGEYLDRLAAADGFSGAVLVARGGRSVFERAYGEASKSYGVLNAVDTKFNLGSMNKMFTAVAVAQLVERGVLSWDDPIGKWLDADWVRPEVGEKATIRHLLTHTSGLGSFFNDEFMRSSRGRVRDREAGKPRVS